MPFIPHTEDDVKEMLQSIQASSIDDLFEEIPKNLQLKAPLNIPPGMNEMSLSRWMHDLAEKDAYKLNFIGAGAYEHYIPKAVWQIAARGEWMTSYTPYQAEASQGTLQLLYEYQTMMAHLMHLEVSNASMYDGATSLAEAVLMAVRISTKKSDEASSKNSKRIHDKEKPTEKTTTKPTAKATANADAQNKAFITSKTSKNSKTSKILMPVTVHPFCRQVVQTIVAPQNIELIELPYSKENGKIDLKFLESLEKLESNGDKIDANSITALVIPQPNFFGILEEVDHLCDFAKKHNIIVIAYVNPLSMALLKPPGLWGNDGVDIACGEVQPFGIPLASGGPYLGLLTCKKRYIRQLPGRLVGRTKDAKGKEGFTLTLQAREQHIRRSKATSNICTNQGLLVTAATIYLCLLGPKGLLNVAKKCHQNALTLIELLKKIKGVSLHFNNSSINNSPINSPINRSPINSSPIFNEFLIQLPKDSKKIVKALSDHKIAAGFVIDNYYPELKNTLLVCVTETKTHQDLLHFANILQTVLEKEF